MTALKPYPEYKDSGVEWIGEIPTGWASAQLQRVARIVNGGTPTPDPANWDGDVKWATPVDLNAADGGVLEDTSRTLTRSGLASGSGAVPPRSVVLSTRAPIGYSAMVSSEMAFNQGCKGIVPGNALDPHFLLFTMQAAKSEMLRRGQGTTFLELSADGLGSLSLPFPSEGEQRAIATLLDRETAEIDAFIADQEELIGLLAERRAATITHAVTKGLDPSVSKKDSGVEWLGDVPDGWGVRAATALGRAFGSEPVGDHELTQDGGTPFLKVSSLSTETFEIREIEWFVNPPRRLLERDPFIVFPKRGAAIFGNKVNIVSHGALLDPNLMGWRVDSGNSPKYFAYALKSLRLEEVADVSTVPQINVKHLRSLKLPVPPPDEQVAIVEHLDRETAELDAAIADARQAIALSRERRAALISAAVTGKVDVRGLA